MTKGTDAATVAGDADGTFYSLTKYSAIFAEVEEYFGIFNNQLGGNALKCSLIFVHECLERSSWSSLFGSCGK